MVSSEKVDVSVIVPSYNSRALITNCLRSILQQKTKCNYEVIVVDSSKDRTSNLIKRTFPSVKVIELKHRTYPGKARNIGIKNSKGQIIVFTDTDCVVTQDWLENIIQAHKKKEGPRVIGGAVCNGTPKNFVGSAEYLLEFNEFTPALPEGEARLLPTCNVSFRREIFEEHGYLDNIIKGSDTLFSRRIVDRGEKIYFTPDFKVYHKNRTNLIKFLKNQYELGLGSAQARKRKEMRGSILVKVPILIPFIPIKRLLGIGERLLHQNKRLFFYFIMTIPFIIVGLLSYTWGFLRGAIRD